MNVCHSLVALLLIVSPAIAQAQGVWTVDDAVATAIAHLPLDAVGEYQIERLAAELDQSLVRPLPRLSLAHEAYVAPSDSRGGESAFGVSQTFDLTPWRDRARVAIPHQEAAVRHGVASMRAELESAARAAFYGVRHREERIAAIDEWIHALSAGVEAAAARESAGDASAYDVLRVERELDIARARRANAAAALVEAWSALDAVAPTAERPALVGDLAPQAPSQSTLREIPELSRLDAIASATEIEASSWDRAGLRGWSIGAAYRLGNSPGTVSHGFGLDLSIPLATRDTFEPRRRALEARAAEIRAEHLVSETIAVAGADAALWRLERTLAAIREMPALGTEGELTRLAELAYAAGETTLTDLLDAYGSETELRLARIDLEWEARRAAIELDRRRGLRRQ